jgi:hypothetical protein
MSSHPHARQDGTVDRIKGFLAVATARCTGTSPTPTIATVVDGVHGQLVTHDARSLEVAATQAESSEIGIDINDSAAWKAAVDEPGMSRIFLCGKGVDEKGLREALLRARVEGGFEVGASISLELVDVAEAVATGGGTGEYSHRLELQGHEVGLYWVNGTFHAVESIKLSADGKARSWAEVLADGGGTRHHQVCVVDDLVYVRLAEGAAELKWSTIDMRYK